MKRDILIFPKFKNLNLIQDVRKKYDRLAQLVPPHITLIFPFTDVISTLELSQKIKDVLKDFQKFNITFKGVTMSKDNYIFLNCLQGYDEIVSLHDTLYKEVLPTHLNKKIKYVPHITLGQSDTLGYLKDFNYEFKCEVDELVIEEIGENEESIILDTIKLK
ncbi:MAG: 2'-5' RNA ligase family protein [Clostridia bacterium]|nr:2'-5' RNA ligase family protein [Clostridia bacterium]